MKFTNTIMLDKSFLILQSSWKVWYVFMIIKFTIFCCGLENHKNHGSNVNFMHGFLPLSSRLEVNVGLTLMESVLVNATIRWKRWDQNLDQSFSVFACYLLILYTPEAKTAHWIFVRHLLQIICLTREEQPKDDIQNIWMTHLMASTFSLLKNNCKFIIVLPITACPFKEGRKCLCIMPFDSKYSR